MRWLLDVRLKYKFFLANNVAFAATLALVVCAMWIHHNDVQSRDRETALTRLDALVPAARQVGRDSLQQVVRGDWFVLDTQEGGQFGSALQQVPAPLIRQLANLRSAKPEVWLQESEGNLPQEAAWVAAAYVDELHMVVGLRAPTLTFYQTFWQQAPVYALVVAVLMLILLVVSQTLISFVERHINRLKEIMVRVQRDSDLTLRVPIDCRDEIGAMADAFNRMQDGYRNAVQAIRDSASELGREVTNLTRAAEQTNQQMVRQQAETDQVAAAMAQMSSAAQEVTRIAAASQDVSVSASDRALAGDASVQQTKTAILTLSDEILSASRLIERLNEDNHRIESATSQIQTISDQTNLLALNAAIEAARAGEVGRGFAVVADEVRNLARHAHDASSAINQVVASIRQLATQVTSTMQASRSKAELCVERAEDAALVLQEINQVVDKIRDNNMMVATAAEEQSQVSETIYQGLKAIREDALKTSNNAGIVSSSGAAIRRQADSLISLVEAMKV